MNKKEYQRTKMRLFVYPLEDIVSTSAQVISDGDLTDVYDDGWTPGEENMRG